MVLSARVICFPAALMIWCTCLCLGDKREVELDKEDWEAEIEGTSEPVQPDQTSHQPQIQYFHQLSLPWERIRIIEDAPSLQECLSRLTQVRFLIALTPDTTLSGFFLTLKVGPYYRGLALSRILPE